MDDDSSDGGTRSYNARAAQRDPGQPVQGRQSSLRAWDGQHGGWLWMSFADGTLPEGQQFLGVVILRAPGIVEASLIAHRLGVNPGGEVQMEVLDDEEGEAFGAGGWTNRLLTREEAEAADDDVRRRMSGADTKK